MGKRVLAFLKRVFEHTRDAHTSPSWSPSTLDPYGLVAIREEERRAAMEAVVPLPSPVTDVEERERTSA